MLEWLWNTNEQKCEIGSQSLTLLDAQIKLNDCIEVGFFRVSFKTSSLYWKVEKPCLFIDHYYYKIPIKNQISKSACKHFACTHREHGTHKIYHDIIFRVFLLFLSTKHTKCGLKTIKITLTIKDHK
jgi:hypothetical protein